MFFSKPVPQELLVMLLLPDPLKPFGGNDVSLLDETDVSVMTLSPELPPESDICLINESIPS